MPEPPPEAESWFAIEPELDGGLMAFVARRIAPTIAVSVMIQKMARTAPRMIFLRLRLLFLEVIVLFVFLIFLLVFAAMGEIIGDMVADDNQTL